MAFLTSRTLASGITGEDLIHIVITGDTSQGNPAGSSYKAKINQLPGNSTGSCFNNFYVDNLYGCPDVITFHDSYQSVDSNSSGLMSRSFGSYNNSYGDYSHTEGSGTTTISEYSHSEGFNTQAGFKAFSGISASTIGYGVITLTGGTDYTSEFPYPGTLILVNISGGGAFSAGKATYFNTNYTGTEFEIYINETELDGQAVFAVVDIENLNSVSANTIFGDYSHSEGYRSKALGPNSHAEGGNRKSSPIPLLSNYSIGEGSHAEGSITKSYGTGSHSEGYNTESNGENSHAEGYNTKTYGENSHSEGNNTIAYGDSSHSEGLDTIANGNYSHTEGQGTISIGDAQHVSGLYNLTASTAGAFIIGNGTDDLNRSNLLIAANDEVIISGLVGVGVTTIDTSAILQLDSTEKGFLPPRMLGSEAESISSPAEGLMVYITNGDGITITSKGWWGFDGTNWVKIGP